MKVVLFLVCFIGSTSALTCRQVGGQHCVAVGCNEHCEALGKKGGYCVFGQDVCTCVCVGDISNVTVPVIKKDRPASMCFKKTDPNAGCYWPHMMGGCSGCANSCGVNGYPYYCCQNDSCCCYTDPGNCDREGVPCKVNYCQ